MAADVQGGAAEDRRLVERVRARLKANGHWDVDDWADAAEALAGRLAARLDEIDDVTPAVVRLRDERDTLREALEEVRRWDSRAAERHGHVGVREFARDVLARLSAATGSATPKGAGPR